MDIHRSISVLTAVALMTQLAQAAAMAAFILRGVAGEFRVFLMFLGANILRWVVLTQLGGSADTVGYRTLWVASEPPFLILQLFVVLEFYRLLYKAYPGIQGFARVLLIVATALALIVTFGTVHLDVGRIVWSVPGVQRLFVLKRVVSSLLGVLLLITMAFFPKAPSALNVRLHGWLLSVFFIASAWGFFGINYGFAAPWMSVVFLSIQFCCFVLWTSLLRPALVRGPQPSPEAITRAERWNDDFMILARWLVR